MVNPGQDLKQYSTERTTLERAEQFAGSNFRDSTPCYTDLIPLPLTILQYDTSLLDYTEDKKRVEWKDGVIFSLFFLFLSLSPALSLLLLLSSLFSSGVCCASALGESVKERR